MSNTIADVAASKRASIGSILTYEINIAVQSDGMDSDPQIEAWIAALKTGGALPDLDRKETT